MKNLTLLLISTVFLFSDSFAQFISPESIAYDLASKRYFVSNTDGGNIVQINQQGTVTDFVTLPGFARPRGIKLVNSILYVANNQTVHGFDITNSLEVFTTQVPNSILLNDIESDNSGFLYVSDMPNNRIVKIDISSGASWTFATGISLPNGILFEQNNNRLLVCTFTMGSSKIHAVNMSDSSVAIVRDLPYQQLDGITRDVNGNIYVSSYFQGEVYKFDPSFTLPPDVLISGLSNPADIYYNFHTDTLVVPDFGANQVLFIHMGLVNITSENEFTPKEFELSQNFPNPFNPETKIRFAVPTGSILENATLEIFNSAGKLVETLLSGSFATGIHEVNWNAGEMPSGVYFYTLRSSNYSETKRMMLVK